MKMFNHMLVRFMISNNSNWNKLLETQEHHINDRFYEYDENDTNLILKRVKPNFTDSMNYVHQYSFVTKRLDIDLSEIEGEIILDEKLKNIFTLVSISTISICIYLMMFVHFQLGLLVTLVIAIRQYLKYNKMQNGFQYFKSQLEQDLFEENN